MVVTKPVTSVPTSAGFTVNARPGVSISGEDKGSLKNLFTQAARRRDGGLGELLEHGSATRRAHGHGPGRLRFNDYFRIGIPPNLLTWLVASVLIPFLWPF